MENTNNTNISWTDLTWNPVSGCSKVSPGCKNCYAEYLTIHRFHRSFDVKLRPERLREPLRISRKTGKYIIPSGSKVFVNSMSDLFHPNVPTQYINSVMDIMRFRPDVIFQVLTKRPEEISLRRRALRPFPDNVWLGVSVELRQYIGRIDEIIKADWGYGIHKGIKFVSFEPLLGDIGAVKFDFKLSNGIEWIIVGGESGVNHRPMQIEWARNLVKQAQDQGVAFWMKQLGGFKPGGNLEDFPEDLRIREFPKMGDKR